MEQFNEIIEDLKSNDSIIQKAALIRVYRMGDEAFGRFAEALSTDEFESVSADMLEVLKNVVCMDDCEDGAGVFEEKHKKSASEIVADWKSGDMRNKLAILTQLPQMDTESHAHVMKLAQEDASPIISLEAENIEKALQDKEAGSENSGDAFYETREYIEKRRSATLVRKSGKNLSEKRYSWWRIRDVSGCFSSIFSRTGLVFLIPHLRWRRPEAWWWPTSMI